MNKAGIGTATNQKPVTFQPLPKFFEPVLQGLAYWVGYERSYFKNYHIAESAAVHEAAKLLSVHIESEQKVFCEVPYSAIKPQNTQKTGTKGKHADILVAKGRITEDCFEFSSVDFLLEVKRYTKPYRKIAEDIEKLCDYLDEAGPYSPVRAFLLVISEHIMPEMFAEIFHHDSSDTVSAKREVFPVINREGYYFKVRRLCKALHTDKHSDTAHFVCTVEVVRDKERVR